MICIDSSVAAKWILPESDSPLALRLYWLAGQNRHSFVAPVLISYEVTNILRQRCRRDGMLADEAARLLLEFLGFSIQFVDPAVYHAEALDIANSMELVASYDAHYLALAQREGCDFWSADRRLLNALRGRLPFVRELATLTDDAIQPAT